MSTKRQILVDTAIELFAQHGFHGTGIDRISEAAHVSKKTMYHHFRSKEELIVAALRHYDGLFRNDFMKSVQQSGATPYARLQGIFDVAHAWFADNKFYGCMFINAIGEYSERNSAISEACKEFKRLVTAYFEELAAAADVDDPENLARALSVLFEGAIVTAQVSGDPQAADTAKRAAKVLIDDALRKN